MKMMKAIINPHCEQIQWNFNAIANSVANKLIFTR